MDVQRPPDMIVLHDADNVATALRDLTAERAVRDRLDELDRDAWLA